MSENATPFEAGRDFPRYTSEAENGLYYVYLTPGTVVRTLDVGHGVYLDLGCGGELLGVEVLAGPQGPFTEPTTEER